MRTSFVAVAIALLTTAAAEAEPAIAIDQLRPAQRGEASLCNATHTWCVTRKQNDGMMEVIRGGSTPHVVALLPLPAGEDFETAPWPAIAIVTLATGDQAILAGVERTERQMYSGGSAAVTRLELYELRNGKAPRLVLNAPLRSSISIRACFTPADERHRRGACKDEYRYRAALASDPKAPGVPRLTYHSLAQTYPGHRARTDDSLQAPSLRPGDLRTVVDPKCSVTRTLTRDRTTGTFRWNMPLPACDDFLSP
jgi:hypothetical protein